MTDAGWHQDPTGQHQVRYHDGTGWTDDVSNDGIQAKAPMPPVPTPASAEKTNRLPAWAPWTIAGVVGLVIGAAAGGSSSSTTETITETNTLASDPVAAKTVTDKGKTVTKTTTKTVTAAASPTPKPASSSGGQKLSFSGNGGRKLPPTTVREDSTLRWTNDGAIFQIFSEELDVTVNSDAKSGSTFVPAGKYTLDVNAVGNWTIKITPR